MKKTDVIICIDDESIILRLIRAQLENHFGDQYQYMMFHDAESAYKEIINLKQNNQNLVMAIVDQILPGQQGTVFLTDISKIYPNVVKILFSGKSDFSAIIQAINEAEIFRYLIKPWDEQDFLNIVDRGLQQYYVKENIELQLAEIHHRVKNNLTIITCLLELQISELRDESSKLHFQNSINRINSIAKVHELIYSSEDMASVDIKKYLEKLIPAIRHSINGLKNVKFDFHIPSHKLKVNQAIPLGLIFNELITNSIKYAFKDSHDCTISIKMKVEHNRITFVYEDNGQGFNYIPEFESPGNLGLTLIRLQLQQLECDYQIDSENKFKLEFTFETNTAKYINESIKKLYPLAY